jgi:hypothetical protein
VSNFKEMLKLKEAQPVAEEDQVQLSSEQRNQLVYRLKSSQFQHDDITLALDQLRESLDSHSLSDEELFRVTVDYLCLHLPETRLPQRFRAKASFEVYMPSAKKHTATGE